MQFPAALPALFGSEAVLRTSKGSGRTDQTSRDDRSESDFDSILKAAKNGSKRSDVSSPANSSSPYVSPISQRRSSPVFSNVESAKPDLFAAFPADQPLTPPVASPNSTRDSSVTVASDGSASHDPDANLHPATDERPRYDLPERTPSAPVRKTLSKARAASAPDTAASSGRETFGAKAPGAKNASAGAAASVSGGNTSAPASPAGSTASPGAGETPGGFLSALFGMIGVFQPQQAGGVSGTLKNFLDTLNASQGSGAASDSAAGVMKAAGGEIVSMLGRLMAELRSLQTKLSAGLASQDGASGLAGKGATDANAGLSWKNSAGFMGGIAGMLASLARKDGAKGVAGVQDEIAALTGGTKNAGVSAESGLAEIFASKLNAFSGDSENGDVVSANGDIFLSGLAAPSGAFGAMPGPAAAHAKGNVSSSLASANSDAPDLMYFPSSSSRNVFVVDLTSGGKESPFQTLQSILQKLDGNQNAPGSGADVSGVDANFAMLLQQQTGTDRSLAVANGKDSASVSDGVLTQTQSALSDMVDRMRGSVLFDPAGMKATIHLDPASLGRVHIQLTLDDANRLQAHVGADNAGARDFLQQNHQQMRDELARHGFQRDKVEITFEEPKEEPSSAAA